MNITLKEFQETAISSLKQEFYKLWSGGQKGSVLVFKSPTGSGKTIMTAEFLRRITDTMQFEADKAFVWVSFNASSYEQSKRSLDKYYDNNAGLNLLDLNDIENGKLKKNDVFFVNWQKLVSKSQANRKLRTDTENTISFDTLIANTHAEGREIVLIIDEAHLAKDTDLANDVIKIIDPKVEIHISATPRHIPNMEEINQGTMAYVSVPHKKVISEGLIKEKIEIMPKEEIEALEQGKKSDLDNLLIDLAIQKKKQLEELYEGKNINPLVLIQLPNDEADTRGTTGQNKLKFVQEYLSDIGIEEDRIAIWLSEKKENLDEIIKNNSEVDFLIFKQAVATGWDCPRAQILVMFREIRNPIFKTQVLGRILRMPEAKSYIDQPELNRSYVYTSYEMEKIEESQRGIGENKVAFKKSYLRKGIDNIELNSVFLKRGKYNDLGDTFQKTFIEVANKYFGLNGKEIFGKVEEKLLKKGLDINNNEVKNSLIVNAEIEVYDNFREELFLAKDRLNHKASYHDTQKLYNLLLWREIANQQEDKKKFAPERSWGKLKTAINVWMKEHLEIQNPPLYAIVCNDLEKDADSIFKKIIAEALEIYKPIRNKEEEEKLEKMEEKRIFHLHDQYSFTEDYEEIEDIKLSANLPFLHNKKTTSSVETDFIKHLENQNIDWWFKNGDYGRDSFALKYRDKHNELKLFYPDFLIKQGNKLGIFDTKGGITADTSKEKAEALQGYIKKYSSKDLELWGGILIKDSNDVWKLNAQKKYSYNSKDLSGWIDLEL